ncbi:hypothetical protein N4T20_13780 [Flavobacterium sp. TR2]|uniref:hypothetical protein n=1 Tax=Flavobacterium sp. TR2 TaxID=2977321 RepID=UPI0021B13347|nr:hypothetical protein [Flavobacterium sp. TR2]UWY26789.1 hypothetical protein N4T20_13780 [Flavobacterium sp. TR2]
MEKDFIYGMKVSLDDEFGIVIKDKVNQSNFCGLIRWDTPKENDTEDWRGQFATFIAMGGKILGSSYSFQFINDDGSLK